MRRVEQIMGMPISVDIPGCADERVYSAVFERLLDIDARFSTYKPRSEVSKYAGGQIAEADLSRELNDVIKACRAAEKRTGGYFSAWHSGKFDPSGYVKGWAVSEAGSVIEGYGYKTYCIGAGGDILARSNGDKIWNIAIQNPMSRDEILSLLSISNGAVTTSGRYERGDHIINPKTKKPAAGLLSVSVAGPDIVQADILATAGFAMGPDCLDFIVKNPGYEALVVDEDGGLHATRGFTSFIPHSLGSSR